MNDTIPMYSDGALVQQIEDFLRARMTDHMLGLKVRLLFEARDEARRPAPPAEKERRGWWSDPGSGGGAVIPLPDDNADDRARGTAWERHDDPREPRGS